MSKEIKTADTTEEIEKPEASESVDTEKPKQKGLIQFIKFGLVGLFNTFLHMGIYNFCYYVFGINYHISNAIAFVISVFSAYILQNFFVFKKEDQDEKRVWWQVLIKTYASYAFTGLFLTEILLTFWIDIVRLENFIGPLVDIASRIGITMSNKDMAVTLAPFINMCITIPTNFFLNKKWTYKK